MKGLTFYASAVLYNSEVCYVSWFFQSDLFAYEERIFGRPEKRPGMELVFVFYEVFETLKNFKFSLIR